MGEKPAALQEGGGKRNLNDLSYSMSRCSMVAVYYQNTGNGGTLYQHQTIRGGRGMGVGLQPWMMCKQVLRFRARVQSAQQLIVNTSILGSRTSSAGFRQFRSLKYLDTYG